MDKIKQLILVFILVLFAVPGWGANCGDGVAACACGDTLTADYTLTGNLTCTNAGYALTVGADNVDFNDGGYNITGDGVNVTGAIYAIDRDNITIVGSGTWSGFHNSGSANGAITIQGGVGITISGESVGSRLTITGVSTDDFGGSDAVLINSSGAGNSDGVEVKWLTIGQSGVADTITRMGIVAYAGDNLSFHDNNIYGGKIGIDIGDWTGAAKTVTNVDIYNNTIDTLANTALVGGTALHIGIAVVETDSVISGDINIYNNTINLNDELFTASGSGIYVQAVTDGSYSIYKNVVSGVAIGAYLWGPLDEPFNFYNNKITAGPTIEDKGVYLRSTNGVMAQIKIYNNLILDFEEGITTGGGNTIAFEVYNNNIDCEGTDLGFKLADASYTATLKNNIFFGTPVAGGVYIQVASATPTLTSNNNLFESSGNYFNWQNTGPDIDFSTYQTNSSQDANSINSDPLFLDAANDNFRLAEGSPAIDTGTKLSIHVDGWESYYGDNRGCEDNFDIGADELGNCMASAGSRNLMLGFLGRRPAFDGISWFGSADNVYGTAEYGTNNYGS